MENNGNISSEIDQLASVVGAQSVNIQNLLTALEVFGGQLQERPTRGGVWKIVGIAGGLIVAFLLTLSYLAYDSSKSALDQVKDCTTPTGECAQRSAEGTTQAIGQIVCNQEKIVYMIDIDYIPFPYCIQFINNEIERTHLDVPPLPVPEDVPQIVLNAAPRET